MTADPAPVHQRAAIADLLWVLLLMAATYLGATKLELFEHFGRFVSRFERWQVDELMFTLLSGSAGLAWYGWRRQRETARALRRSRISEAQVAELLGRNRELAQQVISAQEAERLELARELHDEMGQCCNAISVEATIIAQGEHADLDALRAGALRIDALSDQLYRRMRALLRKLRPAELDALGLVAALQALCESWETTSGVACVLHPSGEFEDLSPARQIGLYRVAQEALSNVFRHAAARSVRLSLRHEAEGDVWLEVADDGRGFDIHARRSGFGLLGAAERAAALGGRLELESRPEQGSRLRLWLPPEASPK